MKELCDQRTVTCVASYQSNAQRPACRSRSTLPKPAGIARNEADNHTEVRQGPSKTSFAPDRGILYIHDTHSYISLNDMKFKIANFNFACNKTVLFFLNKQLQMFDEKLFKTRKSKLVRIMKFDEMKKGYAAAAAEASRARKIRKIIFSCMQEFPCVNLYNYTQL